MEKERKVQIIKAAVKRFTKHGINKTTLDEIARDLRIGKATIYNYFKSKEELYYTTIKWRTDEYIDEIRKIFSNGELTFEEKLLQYFTYKENLHNNFQLIYELVIILMSDHEKERESDALKYLVKSEEELIGELFKSITNKKGIPDNFPAFLVLQSWGLLFSSKVSFIYDNERVINSKETILECCIKQMLN